MSRYSTAYYVSDVESVPVPLLRDRQSVILLHRKALAPVNTVKTQASNASQPTSTSCEQLFIYSGE